MRPSPGRKLWREIGLRAPDLGRDGDRHGVERTTEPMDREAEESSK